MDHGEKLVDPFTHVQNFVVILLQFVSFQALFGEVDFEVIEDGQRLVVVLDINGAEGVNRGHEVGFGVVLLQEVPVEVDSDQQSQIRRQPGLLAVTHKVLVVQEVDDPGVVVLNDWLDVEVLVVFLHEVFPLVVVVSSLLPENGLEFLQAILELEEGSKLKLTLSPDAAPVSEEDEGVS